MRRPNFFIIGAPKCGTTSFAQWLGAHPGVYMSPIKEPHFFNFDYGWHSVEGLDEYERLFAQAGSSHVAVGEASTGYLYSRTAVPAIERYAPRARYIVLLRNPVEMAYSLHGEQVYGGREQIDDFAAAWSKRAERRYGREVLVACPDPQILFYDQVCLLGEQLERLFSTVERERVLVIVMDDLKSSPQDEYEKTLRFLGLSSDGRQSFPVVNRAKAWRYPSLLRAVRALGKGKRALGIRHRFGVLQALNRSNTQERRRSPMPAALRRELVDYFAPDVAKLAQLIDRDLSHWLAEGSGTR